MPDRNDRVLMSVGGVMKAIDRHNFVNGFLDDYATLDNGKVPDDISAPPSSAPASSPVNRNDCVLMVIGGRMQAVDRSGFVAFLNDTADQDDGTPAGTLVLPPTAQPAGTYSVDRNCKVAMSSGGGMMLVDRATFMHFLNDNLVQDDGTPAATINLPAIACPYALAGGIPGYLTPDIAGQTVSKTTTTASGGNEQYLALGDFASFWPAGVRYVEGRLLEWVDVVNGNGQASIVLATDSGQTVVCGWVGSGWSLVLYAGGVPIGSASSAAPIDAVPAIGVDPASRNVYAYIDGVQITDGAFAAGGAAEGFLTGSAVAAGISLAFQSNGTESMKLVSAAGDFAFSYGAGLDWCGNAIP